METRIGNRRRPSAPLRTPALAICNLDRNRNPQPVLLCRPRLQVVRPGHRRQPGDAGAAPRHHRAGRRQRRRQEHAAAPGHRPAAAGPRHASQVAGPRRLDGRGQAARRLLPRSRRLLRGNVGPAVRRRRWPGCAATPRAEARRRTDEVLELVGMADRADRRSRGYSKGMRQRIKLAQALLHDPRLLVLDEPLSGIDPIGRREFVALFRELAGARQVPADLQPRAGRAGEADRSRRHHGPRPHRRRRHGDADPRSARRPSADDPHRPAAGRGAEQSGDKDATARELAAALLRLAGRGRRRDCPRTRAGKARRRPGAGAGANPQRFFQDLTPAGAGRVVRGAPSGDAGRLGRGGPGLSAGRA